MMEVEPPAKRSFQADVRGHFRLGRRGDIMRRSPHHGRSANGCDCSAETAHALNNNTTTIA